MDTSDLSREPMGGQVSTRAPVSAPKPSASKVAKCQALLNPYQRSARVALQDLVAQSATGSKCARKWARASISEAGIGAITSAIAGSYPGRSPFLYSRSAFAR